MQSFGSSVTVMICGLLSWRCISLPRYIFILGNPIHYYIQLWLLVRLQLSPYVQYVHWYGDSWGPAIALSAEVLQSFDGPKALD
jgi:hypothetical protein